MPTVPVGVGVSTPPSGTVPVAMASLADVERFFERFFERSSATLFRARIQLSFKYAPE